MAETAQREGRRLAEMLAQQRDAYRRLHELAQTQRGAIESEKPEELLRILGQRQRLIAELTEINEQLEPLRSRWGDIRPALPASERLRISELVDEVQHLLVGILDQDQGDCETLKQRAKQCRAGAASAATGKKLNAAYGAAGYAVGAKFLDTTDKEGGLG